MSSAGLRLAGLSSSRRITSVLRVGGTRWARRSVHYRQTLPYNEAEGVGSFLPPAALKTVGVDFQQGLLDRLNDEVRGTDLENLSVAQTVIQTAPDRSRTLAFNYASQALNNSYFLSCIKPPTGVQNHEEALSRELISTIRHNHGSFAQFKSNFSATALGMISSGWVWFVTDDQGETAILPTFGAGSLLVRSRSQVLPGNLMVPASTNIKREASDEDFAEEMKNMEEMTDKEDAAIRRELDKALWSPGDVSKPSTPSPGETSSADGIHSPDPTAVSDGPAPASPVSGISHPLEPINPRTPGRSLHTSVARHVPNLSNFPAYAPQGLHSYQEPTAKAVAKDSFSKLGDILYPLLCISVHEHAWMSAGRGVWGKEEYLREFWNVVDWQKVSWNYSTHVKGRSGI